MINFSEYQIDESQSTSNGAKFAVVGHPIIKTIFIFGNSNVAVCGHDGQQIPEMQGPLVGLLEQVAERAKEGHGKD